MTHDRREFLLFLGSVLLAPPTHSLNAGRPVAARYSGAALKSLVAKAANELGFCLRWDAFVTPVVDSTSEWILEEVSRLRIVAKALDLSRTDVADLLRSRNVAEACEVEYQNATCSYFVEITAFETTDACQLAWKQLDRNAAEAALAPYSGIGEAMFVSQGGWSLPGKVFLRRENFYISVLPVFCPPESAIEFAGELDRKLTAAA